MIGIQSFSTNANLPRRNLKKPWRSSTISVSGVPWLRHFKIAMNGIPSGLIEIFVCFLETPATQEHRYSVHSHTNIWDEVSVFRMYSPKLLWIYTGFGSSLFLAWNNFNFKGCLRFIHFSMCVFTISVIIQFVFYWKALKQSNPN